MDGVSTNKDFIEHIEEFKTDKNEHIRFAILQQDEVTYGYESDCDVQYCLDHNIPCYDRKGPGGTIVHAKGSLALNYFYSHDRFPEFLSISFLRNLCSFLQSLGLNAQIDSNDILIDEYKVASCAEANLPPDYRWCNIVILVATTQNIELIKQVCLKPMKKIPKALNDFGVSTETMIDFIIFWFQNKKVDIGQPT